MTTFAIVAEFFHIFLIYVMLFSAIGKLISINAFKENLKTSFGINPPWNSRFAFYIVMVELLIGVALLIEGVLFIVALYAAFLIIGLFSVVVFYFYYNSGNVKCSCFGENNQAVSSWDFIRNLFILFSIIWIFLFKNEIPIGLFMHIALACCSLLLFFLINNIASIVLIARSR